MRCMSIVFALTAWNCALAQGAARECTPPVAQTSSVVAGTCATDDAGCLAWRRFRAQHPFPYQTIAVDVSSDATRATIVVSEPPPLGVGPQYAELFKATFQVPSDAVRNMRYQVGVDGWLEDWVISVPLSAAGTIPVPGPDAKPIALPVDLASKLDFVSRAMYGTRVGFYIEAIGQSSSPQLPATALSNLRVTADSLGRLGKERVAGWIDISSSTSSSKTFAEARALRNPSTLINPKAGVVMLTIPAGTRVGDLRSEFRKFAVSSDYLIGSIRAKHSGLLLLGRSRAESLAVLPPLRFETLQSFARNLRQPLGQSYERQRIFAGKIASGPYAGWDWAPIYLSTQLQDSEFGTLLNIADQQLKSWSECSHVRYAAFDYPSPVAFPFGKLPASTWVMERALSPTLIFNWNTSGFATVSESAHGRIVSAMGTAALPVSYIVPDDPETKALQILMQAIEGRGKGEGPLVDAATTASNIGSEYFEKRGDPIIARVAQNVLLYQILGDAKPFAPSDAEEFALAKAADRSDIVTKLLVAEATPWLSSMLDAPGGVKIAVTEGGPATDLRAAMQRTGLTTGKLAELLATPQYQAQRMLALKADVDLKIAGLGQLEERWKAAVAEAEEAQAQSTAGFRKHCASVGGAISTVKEKGEGYLRCNWTESANRPKSVYADPYAARLMELRAELETIKRDAATVHADVKSKLISLKTFDAQNSLADAVGAELRRSVTDSVGLDAVFQKVLVATAAAESKSSIQTPSVVLSQNVAEKFSVGGHNIDGLPWDVQTAATKSGQGLRWIGDRPTVLVPKDQTGNSAAVARSLVTKEAPAPQIEGAMLETLKLSEAPPTSFVEMLAQAGKLPSPDADLMSRAMLCRCDVYVERSGSNVTFVVETKPPPKARTILGDSGVRDDLAKEARGKTVLFAGFPKERVMAISEGVESVGKPPVLRAGPLEESIATAKKYFSKTSDAVSQILSIRTKEGRAFQLKSDGVADDTQLLRMLAERPLWRNATVAGNKPTVESAHLVEVQFSSQEPSLGRVMKVFVRNESGGPAAMDPAVAVISAKAALASAARDKAEVGEAVSRVVDKLYRGNKDVRSVDVFLDSVDRITFIFDPREGELIRVALNE